MSDLSDRIEAILRARSKGGLLPRGQQKAIAEEAGVTSEYVRQIMVAVAVRVAPPLARARPPCLWQTSASESARRLSLRRLPRRRYQLCDVRHHSGSEAGASPPGQHVCSAQCRRNFPGEATATEFSRRRVAAGMNQAAVARALGVGTSTVRRWELGEVDPGPTRWAQLDVLSAEK